MQQISIEEVKGVPLCDRMSVEESWRLRELRSFVVRREKNLDLLRVQKMMEQWKRKGFDPAC